MPQTTNRMAPRTKPTTSSTRPPRMHSSTSGNGAHGALGASSRRARRLTDGTGRGGGAGTGASRRGWPGATGRLRERFPIRGLSAGYGAAGGELDLPPPAQHADQAEPGAHVPHAAAALAEVGVGDAHEAVLARLEQHALEQPAIALLDVGARGELAAGLGEPVRQTVAQVFELGQREHPRARGAARSERDAQPRAWERADQRVLQFALETGHLAAQIAPGGALVVEDAAWDRDPGHIFSLPGVLENSKASPHRLVDEDPRHAGHLDRVDEHPPRLLGHALALEHGPEERRQRAIGVADRQAPVGSGADAQRLAHAVAVERPQRDAGLD